MIDPYKMVFVNVILSLVLLFGTLFYKFIYPKKKINLFILLLLVSILPIVSVFRAGDYESGDFNVHIYREIDFYKSLTEGNIIPSWAAGLNATYGYPLFIFNYNVPYYAFSAIHYLGFDYIFMEKLFLAISFILSGVFMYLLAKEISKNELASFAASVVYLFIPYHLIDEHFKVAIGELCIFLLFPLLFLIEYKLFRKRSILFFLSSSTLVGILVMSHAILSFFCLIFLLCYFLFQSVKTKNYKSFILNALSVIVGLVLSAYIWVAPFLLSPSLYISNIHLGTVYFPTIAELLFSPWRLGFLFQGPMGEISFLIGYTQIAIFLVFVFLLLYKKIPKRYFSESVFWVLSTIAIIFLVSGFSKPIWEILPVISSAGSQRLLVILALCLSIITMYLVLLLNKKKILILIFLFLTVSYTILNWGHRRVIPEIADSNLIKDQPVSTARGEGHYYAATAWVDKNNIWFAKVPKNHIELLKGTAEIKNVFRNSTEHVYNVNAKSQIIVRENTLYFPGWTATTNKKPISIHPDRKGIIQFLLPKGKYKLTLNYNDIFPLQVLKVLSLYGFLSITGLIILIILRKKTTSGL